MICCFPDPYPDELLYSVAARFHRLMKYRNPTYTSVELFGAETAGGAIDLPQRLGYLVENLLPGHLYTVDSLIQENTLLPFYGAFLPPERVARLKNVMEQGGRGGITNRASIRRLKYFQFCNLCVTDDRNQYGQTYWHRIHQTPGVMVCHIHNVFLERCDVDLQHSKTRLKFINADDNTRQDKIRPLNLSDRGHRTLLQIAQDAAWIFSQHDLSSETEVLHDRCRSLLCDNGLGHYYSGKIKDTKLNDEFGKYYDSAFLDLLKCRIDGSYSWLSQLLRNPKSLQYPLRYLLLINFLQCPIERFFQLAKSPKPFGDGPWPCLNAVSDHYKQLCVRECKIDYYTKTFPKRPIGKFRCSCGFEYSRTGPDQSLESRYSFDRILACGAAWENLLVSLYKRSDLRRSEIASRLGISTKYLSNQVKRLKLRGHKKEVTGSNDEQLPEIAVRKRMIIEPDTLNYYRDVWSQAVAKKPKANQSEIRKEITTVYSWLRYHDRDWLNANSPKRLKYPGRSPKYVREQDAEMAITIESFSDALRNSEDFPVRVTLHVIQRRLNTHLGQGNCNQRFPLTAETLRKILETDEEYIIRKIKWASGAYKQEGVKPTFTQLRIRSRMGKLIAKNPMIKEAINHALHEIDEFLNEPK